MKAGAFVLCSSAAASNVNLIPSDSSTYSTKAGGVSKVGTLAPLKEAIQSFN